MNTNQLELFQGGRTDSTFAQLPRYRMRITAPVEAKLRDFHLTAGKSKESMSIVLGHGYTSADGTVTVVLADEDDVLLFDDSCFDRRSSHAVVLSPEVAARINHMAVTRGATAIVNVHDHWFANRADFSGADDAGDMADARNHALAISRFTPPDRPLIAASLLLAQQEWAARVVYAGPDSKPLSPMRVEAIGARLTPLSRARGAIENDGRYLRHRGVLGASMQRHLESLCAVIVGCGGTGSVLAEIAARMGFGRIVLVDMDRVETSNLNRLQGAGPGDVGQLKVDVVADRLRMIRPDAEVQPVASEVFSPECVGLLEQADVVFGCVDNADTRWWLNRFTQQYALPWFDCGVLLETGEQVRSHTRVSAVVPGYTPCGHCSPIEFFDRGTPRAFLDGVTLQAMRHAGYVEGAGRTGDGDPVVYPLTLQAAAWLGQELLAWLGAGALPALSVYHRSDKPLIERLPIDVFSGQRPQDCPVCGLLLGRCRTHPLPSRPSPQPAPAPFSTSLFE